MSTQTSNVYTGAEARERLYRGADAVADAVKLTLGAGGSNAILEAPVSPGHRVTNDGVSVAQSIYLSDPVERMGANIMKEIALRADEESGDGTTTATVVAQVINNEGKVVEGGTAMQLKRDLDACIPLIFKAIDDQKQIITVDEVGKVAAISAEDEEVGALLQEIYQKIGPDGIVEMDNSNLPTTFYEVTEGVRVRAGFLGQYSCTEPGKAVFKAPKILVSQEKISSVDQITPIVEALAKNGADGLVIYCEEMDMSVAARLALTHLNGGFKTLVIQAPVLWKDWVYEDLSKLTGATPVDFKNGKTFKNLTIQDLGTCDKIIATKDETRILGTLDISEHVAALKEAGKTDDQQLVRASWIQTKVAVLKVGANSETELSYRRLKAIDAISASHLALADGVVAGGGVALYNCALALDPSENQAKAILHKALQAPMHQILENAGLPRTDRTKASNEGIDANTGKKVDMFEAGIIDPAQVVKNSVKSAISTAGTLLTTRVAVHLPQQDLLEQLKAALAPSPYG